MIFPSILTELNFVVDNKAGIDRAIVDKALFPTVDKHAPVTRGVAMVLAPWARSTNGVPFQCLNT